MLVGRHNLYMDGEIYRYKKDLKEKIDRAVRLGKVAFMYDLVNDGQFDIFIYNAAVINLKTKRDNHKCLVIDNHHVS